MLIECSMEDFIDYIADDPVRPHLLEDNVTRFEKKFRVFADVDKQGFDMKVNAIVCTVMCPFIPRTEDQLRTYATGVIADIIAEVAAQFDADTKSIDTVF